MDWCSWRSEFDGDRCWWSACDGTFGLTKIGGLERRCGACDGCGVDGVLALVLLGFDREREEERRERKERGNGREIRKKKEEESRGSIGKRNGR